MSEAEILRRIETYDAEIISFCEAIPAAAIQIPGAQQCQKQKF